MNTVDIQITIKRKSRAKLTTEAPAPRMPRITQLMALAIKFQEMVDRGGVSDYADLARLGYVSRARITQIMNLLNLAADIQEAILLQQGKSAGIAERDVRAVTSEASWFSQRRIWEKIRGGQ